MLAGETDAIEWLEVVPENYVGRGGRPRRVLEECAERWPMLAHGVSMSLGGPDPFDEAYLAGLKDVLDVLGAELREVRLPRE